MNDNDIVRRTDIINRLLDRAKPLRGLIHVDDVIRTIKVAPSVNLQEPKTGHWICTIEDWNKWTCSECGFCKRTDIHVSLGYNYCPNCGAKMVEPQESEVSDADSD